MKSNSYPKLQQCYRRPHFLPELFVDDLVSTWKRTLPFIRYRGTRCRNSVLFRFFTIFLHVPVYFFLNELQARLFFIYKTTVSRSWNEIMQETGHSPLYIRSSIYIEFMKCTDSQIHYANINKMKAEPKSTSLEREVRFRMTFLYNNIFHFGKANSLSLIILHSILTILLVGHSVDAVFIIYIPIYKTRKMCFIQFYFVRFPSRLYICTFNEKAIYRQVILILQWIQNVYHLMKTCLYYR